MKLKNTDIQTLLNRVIVEKLNLICFGAGKQLIEACELFDAFNFFDNIYKVADNNPKSFTWRGKTLDTVSPDDIFKLTNPRKIIIYISTLHYPEICEQLEQMPMMKSVECYIHNFVKHMPLPYNISDIICSDRILIPKQIHYCWFGGKEIPAKNRAWMESWEKHCPDYEIIRWDESNYDVSKHPYMYSAYKEKKWAFVSDYARLDIVLENGGIYLDNDVELIRNIDELLYNKCFLGISTTGIIATGLGFGSIANFPLIKAMRDHYDNCKFSCDDKELYFWDNGKHQTIVASAYGFRELNKPQYICEATILPTDVLCPIDEWGTKLSFTSNTFAIHHFDASWFNDKEFNTRKNDLKKFRNFQFQFFGGANND